MSNKKWKIGEKIVAFSEYLNFNKCNIDPLESKKKAIPSLTKADLSGFRGQKKIVKWG